jgi:hypothetical protein
MASAAVLSGLPDRLSSLPHRLLYYILCFMPSKEAASTVMLSRWWPSLWVSYGAVNLDSYSYDHSYNRQPPHGFDNVYAKVEAFIRGMEGALSTTTTARSEPIRRITLHVDDNCYQQHFFTAYRAHGRSGHDMIAALLGSPTTRVAEEVNVKNSIW